MNYRHAFHAGNHADVMKHAVLARILLHLRRKETPFRVVDTHAGVGAYRLDAVEADRTGEWRNGIGLLETALPPPAETLLDPYRAAVSAIRTVEGPMAYPGSPAIAAGMLRSGDRAIFTEKHPADAATLAARFRRHRGVKVLELDGWHALKAFVPPKERRGLLLVDPPYEAPNELADAADRLRDAWSRWPTGIFCLWYPIKSDQAVEAALAPLTAALGPKTLRLELRLPAAAGRLQGSGLVIANAPWPLADESRVLLAALADRLGRGRGEATIAGPAA